MNRHLKNGLRKGRLAAAVFACLAGLGAASQAGVGGAPAPSTRAGQALDWPFPRLDSGSGLLARDIQVATIDGAQCWADGLCRFNGCTTPDPDCGEPPPTAPAVINLSISRHTSSTLSNTTADQILEAATEVLQTNNVGGDDVPCDVTLQRSGSVTTFTTGDGIIDDPASYNAVLALPEKVKVVNQITWCGVDLTVGNPGFVSAAGCAPVPGSSQIVVIWGLTHLDGIIWTHEYGHTQGINHRAADNTRFVMNDSVAGRSTRVSTVECNAIR